MKSNYYSDVSGPLTSVRHGKLRGSDKDVYELTITLHESSSVLPPMHISSGLVLKYFGPLDEDVINPGTHVRLQEEIENGMIHQHLIIKAKNYVASGNPVPEEYGKKSFEEICKALTETIPPAPA